MIEISTADQKSFNNDGFFIIDSLIDISIVPGLHHDFIDLFRGKFETGVRPDEVNWQEVTGDPSLSRQICNGWS